MATLQDIRRRIRSVSNTRKITRAIELVAASKLRRAQQRIEDMRPYADRMLELMAGTARASTSVRGLPFCSSVSEVKTVAMVPVMGDRGLSGAFNSQILRRALAVQPEPAGRGQAGALGRCRPARRQLPALPPPRPRRRVPGFTDDPRYADAQAIAHKVSELYTNEEVDRVVVIYNHFESALSQVVTRAGVAAALGRRCSRRTRRSARRKRCSGDFIFEPEPEEILERLLPVYVETELYRALLESAASKHGAQMTAMRNASKNAGELIDSLTLAMNRARQAEITQEILEVVAGADALTA